MSEKIYDVIIIGGGPAGLTAGIYTSRERIPTLLLEKGACGGLVSVTDTVENFPGFPDGIKGLELAEKFKKQALRFGTEIKEFTEVKSIEPLGDKIKVITERGEYTSYTVIVATGAMPKKLSIPGEDVFIGKGVSFCATCDGPLFKNKDVVVLGGGNAALEESLFLSKFARKVTIVHRRFELRGAKIYQEQLRKKKNVEFLLNYIPISIKGDAFVDSIVVQEKQSGEQKAIKAQGIFIYIGYLPNSTFLGGIVGLDDIGCIKTDEKMQTSVPGIFAAGDIRSKRDHQIAVACAEGTIAALSIREYLPPRK